MHTEERVVELFAAANPVADLGFSSTRSTSVVSSNSPDLATVGSTSLSSLIARRRRGGVHRGCLLPLR